MALEDWCKIPVETEKSTVVGKRKRGGQLVLWVDDRARKCSYMYTQRQETAYSSGKAAFVCPVIGFLPPDNKVFFTMQ